MHRSILLITAIFVLSNIDASSYKLVNSNKPRDQFSCPVECRCKPENNVDFSTTCNQGGLDDNGLARVLVSIPKQSTVIRISAPFNRPNNFSLTQDFVKFKYLKKLTLKNAHLPSLGRRTFESLENLQWLQFPYNNIDFLSPETFLDLDNLEILDLGHNRLKMNMLPSGTFHHLKNLKILDLSGNGIETFAPNLFSGLKKLHTLHLSGNPLYNAFDFDLFQDLPSLESVLLDHCSLNFVPIDAFKANPKLHSISLAHNRLNIGSLKNFLQNHPNMQFLDLTDTGLSNPSEVLQFTPKIRRLNLANNARKYDKARFTTTLYNNMPNLTHLNVSGNFLTESDILEMTSSFSDQLLSLDISHNPIGEFTPNFTQSFPNLRELFARNIDLVTMTNIFPFPGLQLLDLSHNHLMKIPENLVAEFERLKSIDISHNQLSSLPKNFANLFDDKKRLISNPTIILNDNPWQCSCDLMSILTKYIHQSSMSSDCQKIHVENLTCFWPKSGQQRQSIAEMTEKSVLDCSRRQFDASTWFARQSELTLMLVGLGGLALASMLVMAMFYSYCTPRASYLTNEEKAALSVSSGSGLEGGATTSSMTSSPDETSMCKQTELIF